MRTSRLSWGGLLVGALALAGCERASEASSPAWTEGTGIERTQRGIEGPKAPGSSTRAEAYGLRATVTLQQAGLTSEVEVTCRLVQTEGEWRVEQIREQITLDADGTTRSQRSTRADFNAQDPLSALGLPAHLLAVSGYGVEAQTREFTLPVGGLKVPLHQVVSANASRATGSAKLAGGPIELHLQATSRWEEGPSALPRRLIVEFASQARGGEGEDAASLVTLDLQVEAEARS